MDGYFWWIAIIVLLCAIEAASVNLVTIWFAIGAVGGLVLNMLGADVFYQILCFMIISCILLAFTKPIVEKKFKLKKEATNADMSIGKTAVVIEEITPDKFAGQVKVSGNVWSAITKDGSIVGVGEKVKVMSIDGVKLIVEKSEQNQASVK